MHTDEIVPCTLLDISPMGASVSCGLIAEDVAVKLRLPELGEIKVSRLRTAGGTERLLFRDTDCNIQRMVHYLLTLIDTGAASPACHRRQFELTAPRAERHDRRLDVNDAMTLRVNQAIALVQQMTVSGGHLPDNVLLFPTRTIFSNPADPSPDTAA